MIDLKKEEYEKKLLGVDCWLEIGKDYGVNDPIKIRIDYPTRSQTVEFRRLLTVWKADLQTEHTQHWLEYYFRSTVREIEGISVEGKAARLTLEGGLAKNLSAGNVDLDVVQVFSTLGILQVVVGMIRSKLEFSDIEKKNSQSPLNSSKKESSPEPQSSPGQTSSTDGDHSQTMEERISSGSPL